MARRGRCGASAIELVFAFHLQRGDRALVESLKKLLAEDTASREIIECKISFELATPAEIVAHRG